MGRNRLWIVVMALVLISACGKDSSPSGGQVTPAPPGTPPGMRPDSNPPPPSNPATERFDILDASFHDATGWKVDTSDAGHQSSTAVPTGLQLSVLSPFLDEDPGRCLSSSVTLSRDNLFGDQQQGTLELAFEVKPFPKDAEYWLRLEAPIGLGHRLLNFTNRGVRTYTTEASLKVSDLTLTPGSHTARLVAKGAQTGLFLDGKKLGTGVFDQAYMTSSDVATVLQLALPEKFPVNSEADCPSAAAVIILDKTRVASQAYFQ